MRFGLLIFSALLSSVAWGQQLEFEAASLKQANPNDTANVIRDLGPDRIAYRNMNLRDLIYQAYGTGLSTAMSVSGGPAWIGRDRYTIEAVAKGKPSDRQFRAMLAKLLEDRFALKTHRETRQIDVYALALDRADGKLGPNLKPWDGTCSGGNSARDYDDATMPRCPGSGFRPPGLVLEGVTMIPLAEMLSTQRRLLGQIVQDRTGLSGRYNVELDFDFANANQPDAAGPSIFTALKEQLGLRLEGSKGPLDVVVVDSASRPSEN